MNDFEKIYSFENLLKAHKQARKSKQGNKEVIEFEMNLSANLVSLSNSIKNKTYNLSGYYTFKIYDPKERTIHALHYVDRVVQHCLCDEVLSKLLEPKLIYDNAACRKNKGTHFAQKRVSFFLSSYYKKYGTEGYILKCDITKFFDHISHTILKEKLEKVVEDKDVLSLLFLIIDSYHTKKGYGLPLGNQTSQWFAIYYLDELDRMIKEQLRIKYYSRYMDDLILIHPSKTFLQECLLEIETILKFNLELSFNTKTQIFPIQNGVDYLSFHYYLTSSGKVIKKIKNGTKKRYKKKMKYLMYAYKEGILSIEEIDCVINSYHAHLKHGHNDKLERKVMKGFVLKK